MKLNKNASFALMRLLGGAKSAAEIAEQMPSVTIRSIQRALVRLADMGLIRRYGVTDPRYTLEYENILKHPVNTALLENINRPVSCFNLSLLEWLLKASNQDMLGMFSADKTIPLKHDRITQREFEHLTVELSWNHRLLKAIHTLCWIRSCF